jgi:predicted nucleic acid-binding Zn ribbon protein
MARGSFHGVKPLHRPRRRNAEPQTAADLVAAVVARIGGDRRARERRIFASYDDAVGEHLRRHTRPDGIRDSTLMVRVSSSAWAHQVALLKGEILSRMAGQLDPGTITDIRTRVGPLHA